MIQQLYCDYNTKVSQGQVCAKIDPRPYQTVVDQMRANLAVANFAPDRFCIGDCKRRGTTRSTPHADSMALAALFVPFLPLVAKQILLNNFLSDFPSIAISTDNVDSSATDRAQRWDTRGIQSFMLLFGLISTAFDLLTFAALLWMFHVSEALFQSTWFVISLLTELVVLLILRTRSACWSSRPSNLLMISTLLVAAFALFLPYMDGITQAFGFVPLPFELLVFAIAIVLLYSVATEAAKRLYYVTHK